MLVGYVYNVASKSLLKLMDDDTGDDDDDHDHAADMAAKSFEFYYVTGIIPRLLLF